MYEQHSLDVSTGEFDDVMDSSAAGYYLKDGLKYQQDFYYIATLITITASSLEELKYKRETMESYLKSMEVEVSNCWNLQEQAFLSYLPLCKLNRTLYMNSRRNILSSGLAGCYPFTSYELSDEDGIMLGTNELNDSLVVTDFFDTERYKNGNISIMGASGAGKTYLLQTLAMRFRRKHIQTFIIAPDKGHEFARACKNIGGQFIMISAASDQCINVMEIRKRDTSANKKLEGNMLEQSELALKIQSLHIFFDLLIPDMDAEEEQLLDEALINTYKKKGITQDNSSLYDPADKSRYREMPILGDVYDELVSMNCRPAERIANIMKRLVTGSAKSFNQQTNVDLDNLYTVIDISTLSGNLLTVGMYIALDYIFSKSKENRTKKKAIIIDEVWELIGSKSNVRAAERVLEIFKIIRGYGGIAICATQDLNDFFALEDGKYGKGIINACKTKIVLNLEVKEAEDVKKLLNLSEEEKKKIVNFGRGHGLLSTNNNNVPIHFRTSQKENDLITTDRKELEQLTSYQEVI